ncbi:Metallo-hydrolase/oxidoreductase [Coemansia reversa NRRL 1564]|uniref:Metallo-hydrolase/oxidoreductase n=1 Tax=Coemansia reversa (strain ATCC 12441 / NRRL 1564) TaxID=763665 RepID=A0A2G5B5E3_COERN|nr:Metallo-hydrolase/oxidoreductase [Coemansia reversa NRRL 1564]|eukprot:PIA14238.1 Metallo-hydrolase/oxidoreductase [Coemansia reversa NRRL 1564]
MDKFAPIQKIAKGIVRVLGMNPGPFTLEGTNTYLIGDGERRVLVDTGDGEHPEYFNLLKQCLGSNNRIDRILLTHWHPDHIGGVSRLLDMHDIVTRSCTVYKYQNEATDSVDPVRDMLALARERDQLRNISDLQVFEVDSLRLQAVFTPGHTEDHTSFTITTNSKPEEPTQDIDCETTLECLLLTGDLILGRGTTTVHELRLYMESLRRMLAMRPSMLLPGHGPIISGEEQGRYNAVRVIEEYIEHRNMRERQIVEVLARQPPAGKPPSPRNGGWLLEEVTSAVYTDIIDPKVMLAAQNNTLLHLGKLEQCGQVIKIQNLYHLIKHDI